MSEFECDETLMLTVLVGRRCWTLLSYDRCISIDDQLQAPAHIDDISYQKATRIYIESHDLFLLLHGVIIPVRRCG